jgi:hypothetical protein
MPVVTSARVFPRNRQGSTMVGGTIHGSNVSATNGFVVLATIASAPPSGTWTTIPIASSAPYRWVKYYGPPNTFGDIAEPELYSGTTHLSGAAFGTAGSRSNRPHSLALDGNTSTYFDGATPSDDYVGLDLASGHVVATPTIAPAGGAVPQTVTLATSTTGDGLVLKYTLDGSDPLTSDTAIAYGGPFQVTAPTTVRAAATGSCIVASDVATSLFNNVTAGRPSGSSSLHIGNSLTDTIDGFMAPIAAAGGVNLDYNRYTVPGIGSWIYHDNPTGGFGVSNVQTFVRGTALDHITMNPYENMPCSPTGFAGSSPAVNRSDAMNIEEAWTDATAHNPNVQMWVYETWPPTPNAGFQTCETGGSWTRWANPTPGWNVLPATWEDAEAHELIWDEAVRAGMIADFPSRPTPYIVPGGRALANLKAQVEAGQFPGVGSGDFWPTFFSDGGTDVHLTSMGRYFVTLVFYTCMFRADPRALADNDLGTGAGMTAAQAAALQQTAFDTITAYPLSGWSR